MEDNFSRKSEDAIDLEELLKKLPEETRRRILDITTGAVLTQEAEERKSA